MRSNLTWLALVVGILCSACQQAPVIPDQPCKVELRLSLSDSPGPNGNPLAHTPWKIAIGDEPEGLALVEEEALMAVGKTDDSGRINLQESESARISAAICAGTKPLWLVYPGQTSRISVTTRSSKWSNEEELYHLMKADGYLDECGDYSESFFSSQCGLDNLEYARQAYGAESKSALLMKLRELRR